MRNLAVILFFGLGILLLGCAQKDTGSANGILNASQNQSANASEAKELRNISLSELAWHNESGNCWMAIEGKVLNLSNFSKHNPAYVPYCGKEATQGYYTKGGNKSHSEFAYTLLPRYTIGRLNDIQTGEIIFNTTTNHSQLIPTDSNLTLTMEEVAKHAEYKDCWMVINGSVLDLSIFLKHDEHSKLYVLWCGKDGTEGFLTKGGSYPHSSFADEMQEEYVIGYLKNES